jgi:hypothetical protein
MFPLPVYKSFGQLSRLDRTTSGRVGSNQQLFELFDCHHSAARLL